MPPELGFVTVSGAQIGLGHLRRCLTLASALRERGAEVRFWLSGDDRGAALAAANGFPVTLAGPRTADAVAAAVISAIPTLVADDYGLTAHDLDALHARGRLGVLDDLAARPLPVDWLLNANPLAAALPYELPAHCERLLGPSYALLGPGFRGVPSRRARARVEKVLVTLGGSDPEGRTASVVDAVRAALPDAAIDVVLGPLAGRSSLAAGPGITIHAALPTLAPLMAEADLAVTGGGQTTYELAAAGVPAIALAMADNQRDNLRALAAAGSLLATDDVGGALAALAGDAARRQSMISAGQRLVDGRGAERAAASLIALATTRNHP